MAQGRQPDWSIPADQKLCLHILQQLCQCMQDRDTSLFPYLIQGVPLGINEQITPSGCFPLHQPEPLFEPPLLSLHHTNWQSAEDEPDIVQDLINKEVEAGWVSCFEGSIEEAQTFFSGGLAIGKLGLALSDSRPPRLVLDSTICGVNPQSPNTREVEPPNGPRCHQSISTSQFLQNYFRCFVRRQKCPQTGGSAITRSWPFMLSVQRQIVLLQSVSLWRSCECPLLVTFGRCLPKVISQNVLSTSRLISLCG